MELMRDTPPNFGGNTISLDSNSSPPSSPPQSPTLSEHECNTVNLHDDEPRAHPGGSEKVVTSLPNGATASSRAKASAKPKTTSDATTAKKPGRKRKDIADATTPADPDKPVKEKKPRKPRDPNAPPRKKQKLSTDASTIKVAAPRPATATSAHVPSSEPHAFATGSRDNHDTGSGAEPLKAAFARIGKVEPDQALNKPMYGLLQQQPSRPQSSGQRYDPIRSASAENAMLRNVGSPTKLASAATPNARASPSIASLIDPPSSYTPRQHTSSTLATGSTTIGSPLSLPVNTKAPSPPVNHAGADKMDLDPPSTEPTGSGKAATGKVTKSGPTQKAVKAESPSNASSPKPVRQKEAPPPLPLGSGLLSGAAFGARSEPSKTQYAEVPNQCIVIDVPITQQTGNYVNFMREVENKYGFDVAYPRLAEHRARMAQMAAAGAALEPEGDDTPMEDSELDSNAEMGGVADDDNATADGKVKKKRRTKINEYDKDDGFIDDTEQLWEEQAMASNNGYFVWSGPLVPETPKPADEKLNGTVSKSGRGGRGRGASTRGETTGRGRGSRGGGTTRGSRGDGTTRKPRITKAERAKLEIEKQERENFAATAQKSEIQAEIEL